MSRSFWPPCTRLKDVGEVTGELNSNVDDVEDDADNEDDKSDVIEGAGDGVLWDIERGDTMGVEERRGAWCEDDEGDGEDEVDDGVLRNIEKSRVRGVVAVALGACVSNNQI